MDLARVSNVVGFNPMSWAKRVPRQGTHGGAGAGHGAEGAPILCTAPCLSFSISNARLNSRPFSGIASLLKDALKV